MRSVWLRQTVFRRNPGGSAIGIQTQSCSAEVRQCEQDEESCQNRDESVSTHGGGFYHG
jgi:hypothetical protein